MNKISIYFITLKFSNRLDIQTSSGSIDNLIYDLFSRFSHETNVNNSSIRLLPLQRNTEELRQSVNDLVAKYSVKIPAINNFSSTLNKLDNNEYFYMIIDRIFTTEETVKVYFHLSSLNQPHFDLYQNIKTAESLFKDIWDNYDIVAQSDENNKKIKIGETDRKKRVCYFCKRTMETGATFKKEAHAISEALGNKNIILNEECDECNDYLGKTIEIALITYLDLYRVFFGILNKDNKVPTIKGKNFEYRNTGNGSVELILFDDGIPRENIGIPPNNILLKFNNKMVQQDIYKALVKYALSIIDSAKMGKFEKTVKWIRTPGLYKDNLPCIGNLIIYQMYREKPSIAVYLRKNNDKSLPYTVGEFHFACFIFVFIIPLFRDDESDFLKEDEFKHFWTFFKHFERFKEFHFDKFSDSVERDVQFSLILEQKVSDELS